MLQKLSNSPAIFNRCVTTLLKSVRELSLRYFEDEFFHSRAMDGQTDVEVQRLHVRKVLTLIREHKLYKNLQKCILAAIEIPLLGCKAGKHGFWSDPERSKRSLSD